MAVSISFRLILQPSPRPAALRRDYREWLAGIAAHTASLIRRGIERAREMILLNDIDLDIAISETTGQVDEETALLLKTAARIMQRAR